MKNKFQIKKYRMLYLSVVILVLSLCTSVVKAQNGNNDASFNTADYVSGQGADNIIRVSAVQSDNKLIIAGSFLQYNGAGAGGLARLEMDGKLDETFNAGSGVDGVINSIALQSNDKAIIAGSFTDYNGTAVNSIARINQDGSFDNTLNSGDGTNEAISQLVIQPNGKILIAGAFSTYNGDTVKGVVRLNRNGTRDNTFNAILPDTLERIHQIALQPDGKIIVAGVTNMFDMYLYTLVRLNSDGTRDYSFNPTGRFTGDLRPTVNSIQLESGGNILISVTIFDASSSVPYHGFLSRIGSGGDEIELKGLFWVNSLRVLSDGKIMAIGFEDVDWYQYEKRVVRLNSDLSVDSTFLFSDNKPYTNEYGVDIETAAYQIDGKIVIAGEFQEINGLISNNIARLNPDGSYDHTFNQHTGFNGPVLASTVYNKRLLIGGEFSRYNYQFRSNLVRLKENGSLDASFNTGTGPNGKVNTIIVQSNGKILIGGSFTSYNGTACGNIARLNSDGSIDTHFYVSTDGEVRKIIIDKDGRPIIAGDFENINGNPRPAIARIRTNGHVDTTFNPTIEAYGRGYDVKVSSRGKIYLAVIYQGGLFSFGTDIYCLNKNGTRDASFNIPTGNFHRINTLAFNNDNKLLAGGTTNISSHFSGLSGIVAQFNADGSIDSTFRYWEVSDALNSYVRTIDVLENDKIVVGGDFTTNEYAPFNHIGLLNNDGSINTDFEGTAGNSVFATVPVRNDKLIIGGSFSEYGAEVRNGIARIDVAVPLEERKKNVLAASQPVDKMQLVAYPNPATASITVDNLEPGSTFRVFNAIGKEMHTEVVTTAKSIIELSDYSNGIYFIVVENSDVKSTSKFIVSK